LWKTLLKKWKSAELSVSISTFAVEKAVEKVNNLSAALNRPPKHVTIFLERRAGHAPPSGQQKHIYPEELFMKWLDKLERRFGRRYIPNLMMVLLCCQAAVWIVMMLLNGGIGAALTLTRAGLAHGQIWRVVTFLFVPPDSSILGFLLGTYLLYFIGTALEHEWGEFRFNLYILASVLGCLAAALVTGSCSNYWLYVSLFLAFAMLYPDMQLLLFFIIPIKVKWLGWMAGVIWLLAFLAGSWAGKAQLVLSMLGFFVFFGPSAVADIKAWIRREQWKRNNRNNWGR
jgi:hypothetical protein